MSIVSNLDELYDYKNKLMEELCSNQTIVRLLKDDDTATVPAADLAYTQIFPYEYVPETVDTATTFICFDVDIDSVYSKTYLSPVLCIWIFTHKSKLHMTGGGVLTDKLSSEVDKVLNGSRMYGLGELNLDSVGRFVPVLDYQGRTLEYKAVDFNRPGVIRDPPAHRKG